MMEPFGTADLFSAKTLWQIVSLEGKRPKLFADFLPLKQARKGYELDLIARLQRSDFNV